MQRKNPGVSAFWIITNTQWEILFLKRKNTGFADGYYQLPSGHLELELQESIEECCIREIYEEVWLRVEKVDLELCFVHHSYGVGTKNYFWFFFKVWRYTGEAINAEPDKAEHIKWIHPNDFDIFQIIQYTKENLRNNMWILRCANYSCPKEFLW